ncbi:hypothetical protein EL17_11850 [Anditalea andensis]|uniref:Uncharacterized protein n=2 Tax=Anditalea andensis TaxID=1048983 RepID=A0A074LII4_9BACT|nr:hypothetical protein EL17_11850 [Anditalea andensis]
MELKRIDNLWNFCRVKTNLPCTKTVDKVVRYSFVKAGITLIHEFKPNLLQTSKLTLIEKGYLDKAKKNIYGAIKKQFGVKTPHLNGSSAIFFPEEILALKKNHNLIVEQDKNGKFCITLSPFVPKNIYDIFNTINLISIHLWKTIYFSELTKN